MRNKDGTFDKRSKAGKELESARKEMEAEIEAKYAPKENYSDSAKNISQEQTTYEEKPRKKSLFSTIIKLSILFVLGYVVYGFITSENKTNSTGSSKSSTEKNQSKTEESNQGIGNY